MGLRLLEVEFLLVLGVGNELYWFLAVYMAIENRMGDAAAESIDTLYFQIDFGLRNLLLLPYLTFV